MAVSLPIFDHLNTELDFRIEMTAILNHITWGGFHKAIYAQHLKFALCTYLFPLI
jgi:hypothetical protein